MSWPDARLIGRDSVRLRLSGTADLVTEVRNEIFVEPVEKVEVRFGDGEFRPADLKPPGNLRWSFVGDVTPEDTGSPTGGRLPITARAVSGDLRRARHHTVTVVFDDDPPELTITQPKQGERVETAGPPYDIVVRGETSDFKVESVECGLSMDSLEPARNLVADWDRWRKDVALPGIGEHVIFARARDRAGNTTTDIVRVEVRPEPPVLTIEDPVEGAFEKEWSEREGLTVEVVGGASDVGSGVATVGWTLDGDDIHGTEDVSAPGENDWSRWRASIGIPSADTERVVIRAEDEVGLVTEESLNSNTIWQLFFQALTQDGQ